MATPDVLHTGEKCILELECTRNSQPFETKTLTFENGVEKYIGRYHKKKTPRCKDDTYLFFDSLAMSKTHASLCYKLGHLYVKDLFSNNGTYLNGESIQPDEINEPRVVKSGDVLRFGKLRMRVANGEVVKPIEAKVSIKYPVRLESEEMPKEVKPTSDDSFKEESYEIGVIASDESYEIAEELMELEILTEAQEMCSKEPMLTTTRYRHFVERGTVTETVDEFYSPSKEKKASCDNCERVTDEFYAYRKWTLVVVAVCMLIIVFYQHV
uniref:FHA domain-containing protein n=1 Tax=Anopheles farauti TaxID=69004 RepID=A0A182R165_9DIPT